MSIWRKASMGLKLLDRLATLHCFFRIEVFDILTFGLLDTRIDFKPDEQHDVVEVKPQHHYEDRTHGAIKLVVTSKAIHKPGEKRRNDDKTDCGKCGPCIESPPFARVPGAVEQ